MNEAEAEPSNSATLMEEQDSTLASTTADCVAVADFVEYIEKQKQKSNGKPKRPLSAYNLFFASERKRLLKEGFFDESLPNNFNRLAKKVAAKWQTLTWSEKAGFQQQAEHERERYKNALEEWKQQHQDAKTEINNDDNEHSDTIASLSNAFRQPGLVSNDANEIDYSDMFRFFNGSTSVDPLDAFSSTYVYNLFSQLDNSDPDYLSNLRYF